jgi:hypothetical protein
MRNAQLWCSGEGVIGARAWRVLFAGISLPLATVAVFYFINHRYDGAALWNIRGVAGVHPTLWLANFVSFLFLYPSTFNLLEVAAVDEPKLHLWESGVMRITRHPQVCLAPLLFSDWTWPRLLVVAAHDFTKPGSWTCPACPCLRACMHIGHAVQAALCTSL